MHLRRRKVYFVAGCAVLVFVVIGHFPEHLRWTMCKPSVDGLPLYQPTSEMGEEQRLLKQMVKILQDRIRLPNDKKKVVFRQPCEQNNKSTKACTGSCKKPLRADPEVRLKKLLFSPKLTLSIEQRENIRSIAQRIPKNDIIIVSAASSNHFDEMQAMFHNLHTKVSPRLPNATVVLFDIGLTAEQRKLTEAKCKCQVISFPAKKFPSHVKNNKCFSWKPLIILATLERARKMIVYQDSSIRWIKDIRIYVDRAEKFGVQLMRFDGSSHVPSHTLKQTFDYVQEMPCAFLPFPELQAGYALYSNDVFIKKALLEPYARCALEASCMCPTDTNKTMSCDKPTAMHRCHRFDQSALTIIAAMLFNDNLYKFTSLEYSYSHPLYVVPKRRDTMPHYFKTQTESLSKSWIPEIPQQ